MQTLFVSFKIALCAALVLCSSAVLAQERTTKGTKIILAVNEQSDAVEHIELLANFQKIKKKKLLELYGHHKFFLGELKGSYLPNESGILLGENTTVIMFTDRQFYPPNHSFQGDHFNPGDEINIGDTKAKVITNKKGELTIKTQ